MFLKSIMPLARTIGWIDKITSSIRLLFKNMEIISEPPTSQISLPFDLIRCFTNCVLYQR